jgi:excisionase family DNA binding protein
MRTTETLLAPKEAAVKLRCSVKTVYKAIHAGQLAAVRLGENGSLRVTEAALRESLRPASPETRQQP